MERDKALDMAVGQIHRQYGKGAIMKMGDVADRKIEVIPTGALALDLALGVGGVPRGRVVELYGTESSGKTTLALHVIAEAQRNGGIAAFIDAEHALDPGYAKAIGVDIDELLISQPDTGEQALEIADMLIRSGALDVVVIDSVAALVPKAEIDGEMGDTHIGLQARLMSQALRKLTGSLARSRTTAVFINQLREKIGVMFGCLSYGTRVTLADGTQEKIGKIVNQRLPVEVLSYDFASRQVVPRRVVNWFDNGRADQFLQFTVAKPSGNGRAQFAVTRNHKIMTPSGWKEAGELKVGDRVLESVTQHLSDQQMEIVRGSLMGDGALSPAKNGYSARFRLGHGVRQVAYADWKAELLANIGHSRSVNDKGAVFYDFAPMTELIGMREAVYVEGKKLFDEEYLKRLTPMSLAIWYMDDATFSLRSKGLQERTAGGSGRIEICVEALEPDTRMRLVEYLRETWSISGRLRASGATGKAVLTFDRSATDKFQELIAPFVHPSMAYKLLPRYHGRFAVDYCTTEMRYELEAYPILDIHIKPKARSMHRFDIEVEGSHNYFADGVMVHNSPEVTPGGRALKFYSSVRLEVRRIETIKDGAESVGNRVRVKVTKNKCVAAGTEIFDPTTGLTHRIEDIVNGDQAASVYAADKSGKLHVKPIGTRLNQGDQPVIGLKFRSGQRIMVTPDHLMLTDRGWVMAGELKSGDQIARPRRVGTFGNEQPISPDHARLLGYLVGDGYVGGKTPISFINVAEDLQADVARLVADMGCKVTRKGISSNISHRIGEKNGVLELTRWAGVQGHLAWEKRLPPAFFADGIDPHVVSEVLFGLWETDGWISREQSGGIRVGFVTTSEQLAHQIHWLLLRFGIGSHTGTHKPGSRRSIINGREVRGKRLCWQVRISGIDNVRRFAEVVPLWGPRGRILADELARPEMKAHRGSQMIYLPPVATQPVLGYFDQRGISPREVGSWLGASEQAIQGGFRQLLGMGRIRRDRLSMVAEMLDSDFLRHILDEDLWYDRVWEITPGETMPTYDIEVEELHNFVANDLLVHNCAPPFRQAEFDIVFGHGISREGSLLDVAVDHGVVNKSGAWFTFDGDQLGQGRENAKRFLRENPEIAVQLQAKVYELVGMGEKPVEQETSEVSVDEL
ncbi:MAG: recombinase RecA [Actinobacteria bacterium]|nr:recombinase RecA [Actinomycetota bacterium]